MLICRESIVVCQQMYTVLLFFLMPTSPPHFPSSLTGLGIYVNLLSLSTLQTINHEITLLSEMHFPASCGRWRCHLRPVPFPVPVAILPTPQTLDHTLGPQRKNALSRTAVSSNQLPRIVPSNCSPVQGSVTSHGMWHVSHCCFLLDWKSRTVVMNWPAERDSQKVSGCFASYD